MAPGLIQPDTPSKKEKCSCNKCHSKRSRSCSPQRCGSREKECCKGEKGDKGCKGDNGKDGKDGKDGCDLFSNNITYAKCSMFIIKGHHVYKFNKHSHIANFDFRMPKDYKYTGISFDGTFVWVIAEKCEKVYNYKINPETNEVTTPVKLIFQPVC